MSSADLYATLLVVPLLLSIVAAVAGALLRSGRFRIGGLGRWTLATGVAAAVVAGALVAHHRFAGHGPEALEPMTFRSFLAEHPAPIAIAAVGLAAALVAGSRGR